MFKSTSLSSHPAISEVPGGPRLLTLVKPHSSARLDKAGATASFLCAIHCAIVPFIVTLLPLLGLGFLASEPVEWSLLLCSAALGSTSLCLGFREHRSRAVFAVLGAALTFLVAGRLLEERHWGLLGPLLMVSGGLAMMTAHLINRRLCRSCALCAQSHG